MAALCARQRLGVPVTICQPIRLGGRRFPSGGPPAAAFMEPLDHQLFGSLTTALNLPGVPVGQDTNASAARPREGRSRGVQPRS